jgi:hypothetical protein
MGSKREKKIHTIIAINHFTYFAKPENFLNFGGPYSITRSAVSAKPNTGIFVFLQISCDVFT